MHPGLRSPGLMPTVRGRLSVYLPPIERSICHDIINNGLCFLLGCRNRFKNTILFLYKRRSVQKAYEGQFLYGANRVLFTGIKYKQRLFTFHFFAIHRQ